MAEDIDYSPMTFRDTQNTLGSIRPAGLTHPTLDHSQIPEFMAEKLLEGGYVVRYDPLLAEEILRGRR